MKIYFRSYIYLFCPKFLEPFIFSCSGEEFESNIVVEVKLFSIYSAFIFIIIIFILFLYYSLNFYLDKFGDEKTRL